MRSLSATLLLLIAGCGGGGGNNAEAPPPSAPPVLPPPTPAWHVPTCSSVTGAPITFTSDGGLHRTPIQAPAASDYFTYGVAALEAGSTLVAVVGPRSANSAELYVSTDAGCSWQPSGYTFTSEYGRHFVVTEAGGYAYVWRQGADTIDRIGRTGLTAIDLPDNRWTGSGPSEIGIDPNDPERIRFAVYECERASCGGGVTTYETTDRGATWTMVGTKAPPIALDVRFSPTNLNHVVALSQTPSGHVTFDGGNLWLAAQGVPAGWNARLAAIGHDGQTVWLLANPNIYPAPTNVSVMYVSHDGGLNYQEAFAASDENPFVAWNVGEDDPARHAKIFPHPSDSDVVYLVYPSDVTTYLYRYDAALDQLTKQQWPSSEGDASALAFNPVNADVLYLGLSAVE